jgi:phenylacetate-coenzyme A ligase PaaK-like adenylate-forming protein
VFGNTHTELLERFASTLITSDFARLEETAIALFHFQYDNNPVYRNYCLLINRDKTTVQTLEDIPFLPISAFKTQKVGVGLSGKEQCFESSGTTSSASSKHYVADLRIYERSFRESFHYFYGNIEDYAVLALLPSYLERNNSSLVYMVNDMIQQSKSPQSGFFLNELELLQQTLHELAALNKPTLLIGVSFGLLDFVEKYSLQGFDNLILMETGGMKGRRKELIREELHNLLKSGFGVASVHSEYGMTELLSQAYSKEKGLFSCPPWMKVLIRNQDDPFSYCSIGEMGGINIIDLANLHSCPFIQTDDIGKVHEDGSFEVLGRFDASDIRGCNLLLT